MISLRTVGGPGSGWFREDGHVPSGGANPPSRLEVRPSEISGSLGKFGAECAAFTRGLSQKQQTALQEYKNSAKYVSTNEFLRKQEKRSGFLETKNRIEVLDTCFTAELAEDTTVYRGGWKSAKAGSTFSDRAYVSTSLSYSVAASFTSKGSPRWGDPVFRITLPKGTKVALPAGKYVGEWEVLLPRGAKFKVVGDGKPIREGEKVIDVSLVLRK